MNDSDTRRGNEDLVEDRCAQYTWLGHGGGEGPFRVASPSPLYLTTTLLLAGRLSMPPSTCIQYVSNDVCVQ